VHYVDVVEVAAATAKPSKKVRQHAQERIECRRECLDSRKAGATPGIIAEGVKLLDHAKDPTAIHKAITTLKATDATKARWSDDRTVCLGPQSNWDLHVCHCSS
jgi:hypothetical protein